jgi:hypothetical protein
MRDDYALVVERLRTFSRFFQFVAAEVRSPVRLPLDRAWRGWVRGFGRLANLVYGLDAHGSELFVSSFQQCVSSLRINGYLDHVINNKLLLPQIIGSLGLSAPEMLAYRRSGAWSTADGAGLRDFPGWLGDVLITVPGAVIKPVKGHKGLGLAFLRRSARGVTINGRECATAGVEALLPSACDLVMVRFVEQADYARALYPDTANSIRMLTAWDVDLQAPFVVAAAQRIGTRRSYPVDNWLEGLGGLCAEIDLDTGMMGPAATVEERRRLVWYAQHPETGAAIQGRAVPGWSDIKSKIRQGAGLLPFAPLLGWDILATANGFCVLELNGPPGLHLHQVHRPLFADARLRRFYAAHGIFPRPMRGGAMNE